MLGQQPRRAHAAAQPGHVCIELLQPLRCQRAVLEHGSPQRCSQRCARLAVSVRARLLAAFAAVALVIVAAVILAMTAFSAQVLVVTIEDLVYRYIPAAERAAGYFAWGRIIPFAVLFLAIYTIYRGLTPRKYRDNLYPKWPGAVLVSIWWVGCTMVLPWFVSTVSNYDLTYGSLAGIMIALIFFYLIGLGMVTGAQLNAALANATEIGLKGAKHKNTDNQEFVQK